MTKLDTVMAVQMNRCGLVVFRENNDIGMHILDTNDSMNGVLFKKMPCDEITHI